MQPVHDRDLGTILFPPHDKVMAPIIAANGTWETLECEWLARTLKPGDTFLNVGANVGYHVLRAARLVGPHGRVIAIEPDPENFAYLLANIAIHGLTNVTTIRCAAGSSTAKLRLHRSEFNVGDYRLNPFAAASTSVKVKVRRMDDLLRGQRIDAAVVDTQGWDHEVVAGMAGLGRFPMIVEFTPSWLIERGLDPAQVVRDIQGYGYAVGVLDAGLAPGASAEQAVAATNDDERTYANLELSPVSTGRKTTLHCHVLPTASVCPESFWLSWCRSWSSLPVQLQTRLKHRRHQHRRRPAYPPRRRRQLDQIPYRRSPVRPHLRRRRPRARLPRRLRPYSKVHSRL